MTEVVATEQPTSNVRTFEGEVLRLHKPGENPQIKPEVFFFFFFLIVEFNMFF